MKIHAKFGTKESEIGFINKKRNDTLEIRFGFDKFFSECFIGISDETYRKELTNQSNRESIVSAVKTFGDNKEGYGNYFYIHYFGKEMGNWEENIKCWKGIIDGSTAVSIMEKVKELSDLVMHISLK